MNKKVLTLCAGFLLAGSAFSPIYAHIGEGDDGMKEGQYYRINLRTADSNQANSNAYFLDSDGEQWWSTDSDELFTIGGNSEENGSTWWRKETVKEEATGVIVGYKLVNAAGVYLTVKSEDGKKTYTVFKQDEKSSANGFWRLKTVPDNLAIQNGVAKSDEDYGWGINNVEINPTTYSKDQLNLLLDGKFAIQIGYQEDTNKNNVIDDNEWYEYASFEGENVFSGYLYIGNANSSEAASETTTTGYALYKDEAKTQRVVLTKTQWEKYSSELSEGFKFDVLTSKEYAAEIKKGDDSNILADKFLISVPATESGDPIEVVAVNGETKYEVVVSVVKNADGSVQNRLTVGKTEDNKVADYTLAASSNKANTYIKFGVSNAVNTQDFIGKLWNVYKNGRILSPDCHLEDDAEWIAASEINAKGAEGLWMWDEEDNCFRNRESGKTFTPSGWRYTDTDYTYTNGDDEYTIVAQGTPAPNGTTDGYLASLTDDQLKQRAFNIAAPRTTNSEVDTVYLTKEANGVLSFSLDKAEAVEFRFTREAFGDKENNLEAQLRGKYSAWKANSTTEWESKTDIVKLYQYNITEATTGDVLYFDTKNNQYMLLDTTDMTKEEREELDLQTYVFKEKGDDLYNILLNVTAENYNEKDKLLCLHTLTAVNPRKE